MERTGVLRGEEKKQELIWKTAHYNQRECRERAHRERRGSLKRKKETRNFQAQESIRILILPNEPNFKWKLPPECLLTSKFSDPSSFSPMRDLCHHLCKHGCHIT